MLLKREKGELIFWKRATPSLAHNTITTTTSTTTDRWQRRRRSCIMQRFQSVSLFLTFCFQQNVFTVRLLAHKNEKNKNTKHFHWNHLKSTKKMEEAEIENKIKKRRKMYIHTWTQKNSWIKQTNSKRKIHKNLLFSGIKNERKNSVRFFHFVFWKVHTLSDETSDRKQRKKKYTESFSRGSEREC